MLIPTKKARTDECNPVSYDLSAPASASPRRIEPRSPTQPGRAPSAFWWMARRQAAMREADRFAALFEHHGAICAAADQ
jgi:hypothetical protein